MFTSRHFQRHYRNCDSASTQQLGTAHKTCLRGFGGNGSIAWTSAVSHVGRTSNAFKATMKLQTFLFQMVVTSCISVQYLWKYGFAKSSDNLYTPCIIMSIWHATRKPNTCVHNQCANFVLTGIRFESRRRYWHNVRNFVGFSFPVTVSSLRMVYSVIK